MYLNPQGEGSAATLNGMMEDAPHTTKSNPEKGSGDGGVASGGGLAGTGTGRKRGRSASYKWRSASGGFKRWSTATLTRSDLPPPSTAGDEESGEEMSMAEMFSADAWGGAGADSGTDSRKNSAGAISPAGGGGTGFGPSPRGSVGEAWLCAPEVVREEGESRLGISHGKDERDAVQDLLSGYKGLG
jgi:hypothetical protein